MVTEKELKCIENTLLSYRLKSMFCEHDEEDNYPLIDLLSIGKDISSGKEEVENIMDNIFFVFTRNV